MAQIKKTYITDPGINTLKTISSLMQGAMTFMTDSNFTDSILTMINSVKFW